MSAYKTDKDYRHDADGSVVLIDHGGASNRVRKPVFKGKMTSTIDRKIFIGPPTQLQKALIDLGEYYKKQRGE